jgi:hypothetical protein
MTETKLSDDNAAGGVADEYAGATYVVHRSYTPGSKSTEGNPWGFVETPDRLVEKTPMAECNDHASARAAVVADYAVMNTGSRLVWTRPDWTAVSGTVSWMINIRKSDGTYIHGWRMGPTRIELELLEWGVPKDCLAEGCLVLVLQMKAGMARLVEGNFSGPDYILGKERDFGCAHVADGWYAMLLTPTLKNASRLFGPFDTWEQADGFADKIDFVIQSVEQLKTAAA